MWHYLKYLVFSNNFGALLHVLHILIPKTLSEISVTIEEEVKMDEDDKKASGWDPTRPLYMATKDVATLFGALASAAIYLSVWAVPCWIVFALISSVCWRNTASVK